MTAMRKFGMVVCFLTMLTLRFTSYLEFGFRLTILFAASLYFLISWAASILDGSWLNKVNTFQRTSIVGFLAGYLISWALEAFLHSANNVVFTSVTVLVLSLLCLYHFFDFLSLIHDGERAR